MTTDRQCRLTDLFFCFCVENGFIMGFFLCSEQVITMGSQPLTVSNPEKEKEQKIIPKLPKECG